MEKHFIKINIKSIKKNSNAGNTITHIAGRKTTVFTVKKLPPTFIDGKNCAITKYSVNAYGKFDFTGHIIDESLLQECFKKKYKGLIINISSNVETIRHLPEPEYFYDYENIEIKCCGCGERVMTNDLECDSWDDSYSSTVCPKCREIFCCELEHELIENALLRLKKEQNG